MSASLYGETGLKAFRLSDVPLDIRKAAAKRLSRTNTLPTDNSKPEARLLARVLDVIEHERFDEQNAVLAAAERPSDRVYYVSMAAWTAVMGP